MCLFEAKLNVGEGYPFTKVAVAEPHAAAASTCSLQWEGSLLTGIEAASALSNVAVFCCKEVPDRGAPRYETAAQTVDRYSYC